MPAFAVLGALGVVIVLTVAALGISASSDSTPQHSDQVTVKGDAEPSAGPADQPTSTIITGSTAIFVTTTRPIVTTTTLSTTTTSTKPARQLEAGTGSVSFARGAATTSFTVRTTGRSSVRTFVVDLPDGVTASPVSGVVSRTHPLKVTLRRSDVSAAVSGSFRVVGSDGSNLRIRLSAPGELLRIANVSTSPYPAPCDAPVSLTVTLAGGSASSVRVDYDGGGSDALDRVSDSTWTTTIPGRAGPGQVSGTVVATGGSGTTTTSRFSYRVGSANGSSC